MNIAALEDLRKMCKEYILDIYYIENYSNSIPKEKLFERFENMNLLFRKILETYAIFIHDTESVKEARNSLYEIAEEVMKRDMFTETSSIITFFVGDTRYSKINSKISDLLLKRQYGYI